MIITTRGEERLMSALLEERATIIGGLTNMNNQFVLDSIFTPKVQSILFRTNSSGDVVDIWQIPFQIKLAGPTNFIISSAGPNRKFGDADDIVFNGVANNFVKP